MEKINYFKHYSGIKICFNGLDSEDFLQRLCSGDVKQDGLSVNAFLDRRAKVIAPFYLIKDKDYSIVVSDEFKSDVLSYIDKMLFGENVTFFNQPFIWTEERFNYGPTYDVELTLSDWNSDGNIKGVFYSKKLNKDMKLEFERLSYLAKNPCIDNKCFKKLMILDGPFDHFISRNKGCYPGQEVVEKIYRNRRPTQMFVSQLDSKLANFSNEPLISGKRKIGQLVCPIPDNLRDKSLALAFLRRNKHNLGDEVVTESGLKAKLIL